MDAHIQEFLNYLVAEKGCSDNTIAAYQNDLVQFHAFLTERGSLKSAGGLVGDHAR